MAIGLLAAGQLGCVVRWQLPDPAPSSAHSGERRAGEAAAPLSQERQQLRQELAQVERQLLQAQNDPRAVEQLAQRRLAITVALRVLPAEPAGENSTASIDQALEQADERIRFARVRDRTDTTTPAEPPDVPEEAPTRQPVTIDGAPSDFRRGPAKPAEKEVSKVLSKQEAKPKPSGPLSGKRCPAGYPLCGAATEPTVLPRQDSTREAAVVKPSGGAPNLTPVIQRSFGALLACLTPAQLDDGGLKLRIRLRLARDGSFREPRISSATPVAPPSKRCLNGVLRRMRLPGYKGPSRLVTFPLWLVRND